MEPDHTVYDSITGGALRMARRHWYAIAAAAVIALALGLVASSDTTYSATRTINIMFDAVTQPTQKTDTPRPSVDPLALAQRITTARDEVDIPDSAALTVTGNQLAGSLTLSVTADSEDDAVAALDTMTAEAERITIEEISEPVRTRLTTLEAFLKTIEQRVAALDTRIEEALASGQQVGPSSPLAFQRTAAADEAASVNMEVELARSQLDTFTNRMLTATEPTVEPTDTTMLFPIALLVAGALVACGVLLVLQVVDGRIRRRVHIERDVPRAQVLGVITKQSPPEQVTVLRRALKRFTTESDPTDIKIVDLTGRDVGGLAEQLDSAVEVDVRAVDPATAASSYGEDGTAIVFAVPFGAVTQQRLQAAVADATTSGSSDIGVILTGVPKRDHSWAAVSIH